MSAALYEAAAPVLAAARTLAAGNAPALLAIDGRCGSGCKPGKGTTLRTLPGGGSRWKRGIWPPNTPNGTAILCWTPPAGRCKIETGSFEKSQEGNGSPEGLRRNTF